MRRQRERIGFMRRALVVVSALGLAAGAASGQVTTERSASILVFPKVISQGTRDTIIRISNSSNSMVHAHCLYVNGGLTDPEAAPGPFNPPLWSKIDFDIWLTKQQPTVWTVSEGRRADPTAPSSPCSSDPNCYGAGFDPGAVPPMGTAFTGELKCIEVDASGLPIPGNHIKGEALLVSVGSGSEEDVAAYNALGFLGDPDASGVADEDGVLCLGHDIEPSDQCPNGAEYDGCPNVWVLNHFADDASDPVDNSTSVTTELTIVPCTQNFENQQPETVVVQFELYNEFESKLSASTGVTCWANEQLGDISGAFTRNSQFTDFVQTRMRSASAAGIMIVAEEFHTDSGGEAHSAAFNAFVEGVRQGPDLITLNPDEIVNGPFPAP